MTWAHWRFLLWSVSLVGLLVIIAKLVGLLGFLFAWALVALGYNLRRDGEEIGVYESGAP